MLPTHKKLRCPFCCAPFTPNEVRFRCTNPICRGRTNDLQYNRIVGEKTTRMGRVLIPTRKSALSFSSPHDAICDVCRQTTSVRLCPECHLDLPTDIEQTATYFFVLLGNSGVGKTHFLASLISRLQNEVGPRLKMSINPQGELAIRRWKSQYAPLYTQKTLLQPTRSSEVDPQGMYPQSFRLTLDTGNTKKIANISFFDTSGEDLRHQDDTIVKHYLAHADGILFFIDPLAIHKVSQQIGQRVPSSTATDSGLEQTPYMLRRWIENARDVRPREKITIPTAFVISKIDEITKIIFPGSPLLRPSSILHNTISVDQLQSISTEVNGLLTAWLGPQFSQTIRSEFTSYAYFGVSALGGPVAPGAKVLTAVSPSHVEDPFLWLLLQLQIVKNAKS